MAGGGRRTAESVRTCTHLFSLLRGFGSGRGPDSDGGLATPGQQLARPRSRERARSALRRPGDREGRGPPAGKREPQARPTPRERRGRDPAPAGRDRPTAPHPRGRAPRLPVQDAHRGDRLGDARGCPLAPRMERGSPPAVRGQSTAGESEMFWEEVDLTRFAPVIRSHRSGQRAVPRAKFRSESATTLRCVTVSLR